tara:strand:+ start:10466 stop:10576 length:111 start_codon:yes stop_codon:yes gene_type:complete
MTFLFLKYSIFKLRKQPININAQGYYNAVKPDGWGE